MLCAVCPNPTTVITAGSSTVVCVWDVVVNKDKLVHMKLKQVSLATSLQHRLDTDVLKHWHSRITLSQFCILAFIWSYRCSDVPGRV